MKQFQIIDLSSDSIWDKQYDIAIFASGYESRCVHLARLINPQNITHTLVFGFVEQKTAPKRAENDQYFINNWGLDPILISRDDEKRIYENLSFLTSSIDRPVNLLIDYSSMSRLWYTAVLNWARLAIPDKEINIDFAYTLGRYQMEKSPMVIRDMMSLPGCEGRAFRHKESLAIFGLGFFGFAALTVLDRLEVDSVFTFYALHEPSDEYVDRTISINADLINNPKTIANFGLPLASVENSYRSLANLISPYRSVGEITLVPMGPKPHVLASILVAMRFKEVTCLRISGDIESNDVIAIDEIVVTQVKIF